MIRGRTLARANVLVACLLSAVSALSGPANAAVHSGASLGSVAVPDSNVLVNGWGGSDGYHLAVSTASGPGWRQVALLDPDGIGDLSWTGYQCVSGDGRYAAVVVLPASAVNIQALREHGAFGYAVDLSTGAVHPVATGLAATYSDPGCGTGDDAVFTAALGEDEQATEVIRASLATGRAEQETRVAGQFTSAVPLAGGEIAGVLGTTVETIGPGAPAKGFAPERVVAAPGQPYSLRPAANGDVDFLATRYGDSATAWQEHAGVLAKLGSGPRESVRLIEQEHGSVAASGLTRTTALGRLLSRPSALSVRLAARAAGSTAQPSAPGISPVTSVSAFVPAGVTSQAGNAQAKAAAGGSQAATVRDDAAANAACAVPRLDPHVQALQPSAAQVDWAIELAVAGKLVGGLGRPAGYANLGLPAYAANTDFPAVSLADPSGGGAHTVPPLVFEAIAAQESNFSQASWHALPGISGDPLIADYYGNGGDSIDSIDYASADCGYGIAQVTDGMQAGSTLYKAGEQAKIAVDFEENIAAGLNILEKTWNQLAGLGIVANDGSPAGLENWYFAAWAYNTGIHATSAHGTAGLGWSNNPANPDYPPNRPPYLKDSYADASHPADWPYQERVMGWMGSPLIQFGSRDYGSAVYRNGNDWLQVPPFDIACSATNDCVPAGGTGTPGCTLSDYECWWTGHATWVPDCAANCAISPSVLPLAKEPPVTDPHPPTCSLDAGKVPSAAGKPVVVDDLSATGPLNVVGCSQSPNWRNSGTFTYRPGTNAAGQPIGLIDTHQLGAGFGGHVLFTHVEPVREPGLINTGTWKPRLPGLQYYDLRIHVPATGAEDPAAQYTLTPAPGAVPVVLTVNQQVGEQWINAGSFGMTNGATLTLTNAGASGIGTTDVAFDAVAFVPQGGTPVIQYKGSCPAVDYVAARGSGQPGPGTPNWHSTSGDPLGMGAQLAGIAKKLVASRPKGTVAEQSIGYLADNIVGTKWATTYTRDLEQGVTLTLDDLRQHYAACGPRQRFVLAGYSQGAMVMHRALLALAGSASPADRALLKQVAAVVLVADGDRKPADAVTFAGSAGHSSLGISWEFAAVADAPSQDLPKSLSGRVLSICDHWDAVCDFPVGANLSNPGVLARLAYGFVVHTHHYKTAANVATYVGWTDKRLG